MFIDRVAYEATKSSILIWCCRVDILCCDSKLVVIPKLLAGPVEILGSQVLEAKHIVLISDLIHLRMNKKLVRVAVEW